METNNNTLSKTLLAKSGLPLERSLILLRPSRSTINNGLGGLYI